MFKSVKLDKLFAIIGIVAWTTVSIAQDALPYVTKTMQSKDTSQTTMTSFISSQIGTEISLSQVFNTTSLIGKHSHFQIELDGLPLYEGLVIRSTFNSGKTTVSFPKPSLKNIHNPAIPTSRQLSFQSEIYHSFNSIYTSGYQIVIANKIPTVSYVIRGEIEGFPFEIIYDLQGAEMARKSLTLNNKPDSTVQVLVFLPDPLTRAEKEYGGSLIDLEDSNSTALNELRSSDSISVRWDSLQNSWKLESDYFIGVDLDATPNGNAPRSSDGHFVFGRGEFGFEYVNAFYHIHKQRERMETLGFLGLANYPVKVDAHYGHADQSSFSFNEIEQNGVLRFGDGGVDDAEDADVIVHEYTHALNRSINPSPISGNEREAIEEGSCDFIALTYSRSLSNFNYDKIFNWDGHNEFWIGRSLTNTRSYPSDLENYLYSDAPLWTSALAEIHDYFGRTISERLLFSSTYSYFPYMTMTAAASLYLQADTLLYGAAHTDVISIIFCNRGLLEGCQDTLINEKPLSDPYLAGSEPFAANSGPLRLFPNKRTLLSLELIDLSGKRLMHQEFSNEMKLFYELDFPEIASGYYVLWVQTTEGSFAFKLLKQNN